MLAQAREKIAVSDIFKEENKSNCCASYNTLILIPLSI